VTQAVTTVDPTLDLVLEREIDVPVELVWKAWTEAEHLKQWFAPRPWAITECTVDLRPGGAFSFTMRGPDGEEAPNEMCLLEVVPQQRLTMTDALKAGFRPSENPFFSAIVTMEPRGSGTLYRAVAIHRDEAGRKQHEEMGFHDGWGTVAEQMVEYIKSWKWCESGRLDGDAATAVQ
jgi:uncharacterized protein YndB with AHSA1/START domain